MSGPLGCPWRRKVAVQDLQGPIVGRETELAAVQRFVSDQTHRPASLVLDGVAGIGKTAIWGQALLDAKAAGVAVRSCRCSKSDAAWAFAGSGDLLDDLGQNELAPLPLVQQRALTGALLLTGDARAQPGSRVVGVAVLGVLRGARQAERRIRLCGCGVADLQMGARHADNEQVTQLPRPHPVMAALAAGCPLTLLIDLTDAHGPDSKRIMAREHADMSWLKGLGQKPNRPTGASVAAQEVS